MNSMWKQWIVALFLSGVVAMAAGQDQAAPNTPAQPQGGNAEPAAVDDQRTPAPAFLDSAANTLEFSGELERGNHLKGGIGVGATYDDNALSTSGQRIGDFSYSILPKIELDIMRSRLRWNTAYEAGFIANERLTQRSQGSHSLSTQLGFRLSPHVDLRLSERFLATTGFLQQLLNDSTTPPSGPVNQPNQTVITPLAKTINNTSSADLSYQFSADDVIGVGGTFYDSHFRDLPAGSVGLIDTASRVGDVFYSHRFTPRNWTGFAYRFQDLSFSPGANRARSHSFLVSHTINLQSRMSFSIYAGPEYVQLDSQVVTIIVAPPVISLATVDLTEHQLSLAAGANFSWQGQRTSVRVGTSRKVTDGGGLLGAVRLTSVDGALRRQLAPRTTLTFRGFYGDNFSLGQANVGTVPLKAASGGVAVDQRLMPNLMLRLEYGRDYQNGGAIAQTGEINHNRGSISLSYEFTRPLGR